MENNKPSIKEKIRYAKIFVKINSWEWDSFLGEKPIDFDNLPDCSRDSNEITKDFYINPAMEEIEKKLGKHYKAWESWAWWRYELNKSFIHWIFWYVTAEHH